jgi:hypothetical protein
MLPGTGAVDIVVRCTTAARVSFTRAPDISEVLTCGAGISQIQIPTVRRSARPLWVSAKPDVDWSIAVGQLPA